MKLLFVWFFLLSHSSIIFCFHFFIIVCGCMFCMLLFNFVKYAFLLLCLCILLFRSVYSVSFCCSLYRLCLNVYCTVLYRTVLYCTLLFCCHRVATQLQLTQYIKQIHIFLHKYVMSQKHFVHERS